MDVYVDYSCEDNNETGRTKLTVSDFDTTSIRDVKYAIQAAIQAPVCDQQLFYRGQPVTDDDMTLSRLYFRQGDCFKVQFLTVVNIARMSELVDVLKKFAQEIFEKFNRRPKFETEDNSDGLSQRSYDALVDAIDQLSHSFFIPWKQLRTVAQRHFFVQEGGLDAFLEVLKFSQQLNLVEDCIKNENAVEVTMIPDRVRHLFNLLVLQRHCLSFLWNFSERPQDRKFVLSQDVFPLAVNAILLQPRSLEDTGHSDIARMTVHLNESAVGCCAGLIEFDSNIQEEVSKMPSVIDKLLVIIDRRKSESAGIQYSLFSSQVASNTLFYCTFNVKSAQPLMDCGALEKMLNITKELPYNKRSNTLLRYYCCLFLARLRSAPLVKLDRDTCAAIDEVIDVFLGQHVPSEITEWEERMSYVWMTIVPLVHLAFAAGKEYYCNQTKVLASDTRQSEDPYFLESEQLNAAITEFNEAEAETLRSGDNREERIIHQTSWKGKTIKSPTVYDTSENMKAETSVSGGKSWPGSPSTQKLGIFSLMNMLSLKENQQLALAENLLPYLVCLSWHLKDDEREKLQSILANFPNISSPPSLKVATKSVLALGNGLDIVLNL